ncbi:facilitated trehalose transporter Tret1-like [Coccinella septempunctata]|uniref:facilitated trehalose transporter Tret1-like n=1 Tax=Coccinella septempunctata TaxID=41139 RepID=UPI001D069235|nr:facilitated trehalose transporter Tret1-like [Coccinella septempunctata]
MGALYMYISIFTAQLSFMVASFAVTWSSPMLVKLNGTDDNPLGYVISKTENSFLASTNILGAVIGSVGFGLLDHTFGRKTLLLVLGLPSLIFYSVMAWCKVMWLLMVSRFVIGLSLGGIFTILPMYCGEVADAKNRGILSASMTVFVNIGMLVPYAVGPFIPYFWFHIVLATISGIYIVLFYFFAPESPYHLIKTDEDAARNVLLKLRNKEDVPQIIEEMRLSLKQTTDVSIMEILRSRGLRKTLIIGLGGFTFSQLTGTVIVATYSQTIFEESGTGISSDICPILVAVAQLIMTVFVSAIVDRYPRKFLLTLSHLLVSLVQIPFGAYFFLKKHDYDVDSINWLPLVCLIVYVCVYNIGVGPILMTFLGELFPPKVKGLAIACMTSYNWTGSFLLTTFFNTLNDAIGIGILFWIFSVSGFLATIFIKFFMIETKGKTLEEIQEEINT